MTAAPNQPTLTPAQYHRNSQLFSDHYLDHTLPTRSDWQMLAAESLETRAKLRAILTSFQPSSIEAQTEHDLVRPVLMALGHTFEVQPSLKTPDGTKTPDYMLFNDARARASVRGKVLDDALLKGAAFGVADAKYWDRPLDKALSGAGDPFNNKNPAYQIAFYAQHAGVAWGILTNGRLWRLVHKDTAHKLDRYYEVDLTAVLEREEPEAFLYFYVFFRRAAFDPGSLSLDALLAESADYARSVGEGLKTQVYEALRHLAQGFLDYDGNGLAPTESDLKAIYDHCLIVLYRLLFVFYAEARELLPLVDSPTYRDYYSLRAITRQVARDSASGGHLLTDTALLWPRLKQLFAIINAGSPPLKVATFNGGLFDPARYPFLQTNVVGDAHLEAALDCLARVKGEFIDYRDLSERHLGTIYEGLLEHHLRPIPPEAGWSVDLFNDRGERKRSGSYYTPDVIVKYIVEQTVGPALQEAVESIPATEQARRVDAVLALNCLDPAMGSGHFLVEVVEHIARFLVDLGVHTAAAGESDLAYWKRRVAGSCVYGVDLNPLAVDLAKLSLWLSTAAKDRPLSFLDHHLRVGNSLVGARLSDLGTGGDTSQAAGAPSATERKRARRAAKAAEQAEAAGQISMLEDDAFRQSMSQAVDSMWLIEGIAGLTLADVKQQEQLYLALRDTLTRRYAALANLATARRFGLQVDPELAPRLAEYAAGKSVARFPQFDAVLSHVGDLAERHRFFHWELEFPEVFFDKHGYGLGEEAGFDVVVGNPPYVRQEQVSAQKPYLAGAYAEVYDAAADLYVYFYRRGLELVQEGGRLSYIVNNKWLRAGYGAPLRGYFSRTGHVEQLVDFGHAPIFPDADTFPCILRVRKGAPGDDAATEICKFPREEWGKTDLSPYIRRNSYLVPSRRFNSRPWSLERDEVDALMAKIRGAGVPLDEYVGTRPVVGIKTGYNEAYLIPQRLRDQLVRTHPALDNHIKPYLRGRDVGRWIPEWDGLWIILLKSSTDYEWPWSNQTESEAEAALASTYPALFEHLAKHEERLKKRTDQGRFWWELRSCAYYEVFERSKIVYQDLAFHSRFSLVGPGMLSEMTCFCLSSSDLWVLAVLNSPLMWSYLWRSTIHGKDEVLRLKSMYVVDLPIAAPVEQIRKATESAVRTLMEGSASVIAGRRQVLDWLQVEFDVESPGQKLSAVETLDESSFLTEVRARRPGSAPRLTPAALRDLKAAYAAHVLPVRQLVSQMATTERQVAAWINEAYGLTADETDLMWKTAPPRMPAGVA